MNRKKEPTRTTRLALSLLCLALLTLVPFTTVLAGEDARSARYAALGEHFARQWAATDEASTARYRGLGDYFASGGSDYLCSMC